MLEMLQMFFDNNQYLPETQMKEGAALNQMSHDIAISKLVILVTDLYKGNGYIVSPFKHSGQIYLGLSYPQKPDEIILIVKTKYHKNPISYDSVRSELIKLEIIGIQYNCNQYCLVAPYGFDNEAQKLTQFNLLLCDKLYLEELSKSYSLSNIKEPQIQLFSHNQLTYENVKRKFKESKTVAVVQATGTGKSYLIAKLLSDFKKVNKLVMAPSNYILDQLKEHILWEEKTIFMTYPKGMFITEEEIKALNVGLIVLDEFHRCGAEEWGKGVQNILNAYSDAYIFGSSATPIRYMDNSRDMSQELFKGNVAENLSLAQAIIKRILPMPKYVSALYTLDIETEILKEKINNSQHTETIKNKLLQEIDTFRIDWKKSAGIPQILNKHLEPGMSKFIIFCKEEEHLNEMEKTVEGWFVKAGINKPIKTYRVLHSDSESDKNLSRFKIDTSSDCIHLLFSINMLNEGLHVKDVQGVILLRPTESPNIFYQQIGRCLKVGVNHSAVIFDFVNNFKSIRANNFMYELDFYRAKEQRLRNEAGLEDHCPEFKIIDEVREITEVFGEIDFQISDWNVRYEELVAYKEEFGNCEVRAPYDNKTLINWVSIQRYKKDILSQGKVDRLNELGFIWGIREESWDNMFNKLKVLFAELKQSRIEKKTKNYLQLNDWCNIQRRFYREGRLTVYRLTKLESIGFDFHVEDNFWERMYQRLVEFKNANGHINVLSTDDYQLWQWLKRHRVTKIHIPDNRLALLMELGFVRENKYQQAWKSFYQALLDFKGKFGHCNVPANYKEKINLGSWVSSTRHRKDELSAEKFQQLTDIGFTWTDIKDNNWNERYKQLVEYKKKHNNFAVPFKGELKELASWVFTQRSKKKKIRDDRKQLLDDIGFVWSIK